MKNTKKGFTLIELLVVVAIIGILASVVLASLNTARNKGKDAAVKSQLNSIKTQAFLYSTDNSNSYLGLCAATQANKGLGGTTGPGLLKATSDKTGITSSIVVTAATGGAYNVVTCHDSAGAWAVEAPLSASTSTTSSMVCVDYNNTFKTNSSANLTGSATPATQFDCP